MKMSIKEAMRSAENGCLCDEKEVHEVLTNLLNTPSKEFPAEFRQYIRDLLSCSLEWLKDIDDDAFGEYTYLDLLCMADVSISVLASEDADVYACTSLYSELLFVQFLKKTSTYCTWSSLFNSINVKTLLNTLDYIAQMPENSFNKLLEITNKESGQGIKYNISPNTTVKELVNQTENVIKQFWRPWHDLDEFADRVRVGYDAMNMIIFKCIKRAFTKEFITWRINSHKMHINM